MTNVPRVDPSDLFDEPGMANTLRVALLAMLGSALAFSALTLFLRWRHAPQLALLSAASCLVAFVLSRSGRIRAAMLFPLLSITYAILHLAARSGGIQNIGLAILPVLIILGSLVLSRLTLILFTATEILAIVVMLAIRYFVLQAERYSTNDMGDLFIFILTCATTALMGRLLAVRIEAGYRLIRESESRYCRIFENVQDVYYEMDMDGILLELNPAGAALFGIPREKMIGRPLTPFCENTPEFDALRAAVRVHGRVSNRELVIFSGAAFRHVLVNASLQIDPRTSEERVIGSIRDITERKRAEEALRESERTFRDLLEGVQFVAVVTAANGKIIFCNDYALAITGWSKEEVIGRAAKELLAPESLLRVADLKTTVPPAGRTQPFVEGSILQKNGGRRWIQWSSTPLRDFADRVAGFASLGEDVTELRTLRAEAAKRESEQRFRKMADWAPVMIWISGPDKLCTFFNTPWLDFTGRTMDEEMGHGWATGVHPADLDGCLATYRSSFDARRKFQMEYRLRRADGEYRWLLNNGTPLYRDAEFAGFIGSCIDITERKQAEEALRESEQQVLSIYNTVEDVIFQLAVEPEGRFRFVSVNAAFLRVTGMSLEAVVGKTVDEVIPEPSLAMVLGKYRQAVEENAIIRWEETSDYPVGRLTGEVSVAPVFDRNGICTHLVGSVHDITPRKRVEEVLRSSEEKYRALVEITGTGYNIVDRQGKVIDANREYVRMSGHSELGEILARSVTEWTAAHDKQKNANAVVRCVREGFIRNHIVDYVNRDNRVTPVEINATVVGSGESMRIISLCRDVTERKRAEEERERLQHQLAHAQKMESVGRLAGGVAHDFNNLMSIVLMHADSALEELKPRETAVESVIAIREAAERGVQLGQQLMAFSSKDMPQPEVLNLNSAVGDSQKLVRRIIGEDIRIVFQPATELGLVKADRGQITQIIMNLAVNSRDAMPHGGTLTLETANVRFEEGDAGLEPNAKPGPYVMFAVRDTGGGMDQETMARIFEPFFSTKGIGKGTGLGLSVVYGIVKQNGGFITVQSQPDSGTEFRVYLPLVSQQAAPVVDTTERPMPGGAETILLVEDESTLREKIREVLQKAGYQVLVAGDGQEACRLAMSDSRMVHLLLTDVVMPEMSGPRLAEQLLPDRRAMKVLYISGYPETGESGDAGQVRANLLPKPFTKAKLLSRVRETLDRGST